MENQIKIYRVDLLYIKNGDNILKIYPYKNNQDNSNKLIIENGQIIDNEIKFEEIKDINDYNNRTGIWYSKEVHDIFFSKISLFEETNYLFKYKNLQKNYIVDLDSEDPLISLSNFFESLPKWIENDDEKRKKKVIIDIINKNKRWIINFRAYTGKLKLKNEIIGSENNDIEVIPRKLTNKNYVEMIKTLNSFINQIFFQDKSPTVIHAARDYVPREFNDYDIPKFHLLESIMTELPSYFNGIKQFLNSRFDIKKECIESYKIKDPSTIDFIQTLNNPSCFCEFKKGELDDNIISFPLNSISTIKRFTFTHFYIKSKKITFNTLENQFIKFVFNLLIHEFNRKSIRDCYKNKMFNLDKNNLDNRIATLMDNISYLDREGVGDLQRIPYNSQVLQKNSYYRRFFEYFLWLQYATVFNIENLFSIDMKPMDRLYEYFCLYIMKSALDSLARKRDLLKIYSSNVSECQEIKEKEDFSIYKEIKYLIFKYKYKNNEEIQLIYRPNDDLVGNLVKSYSHGGEQLQPDFILLKKNNNDQKKNSIIIDAKYRPESGDLWKTVHFYKDALIATGAIFINPYTNPKDNEYSGQVFDQKKESLNSFVSGINLLGLKESNNDVFQTEIIKFSTFFEDIINKFF